MTKMKKLLSILLATVMIAAVCGGIQVFAETEEGKQTISFSEIMQFSSTGGVTEEDGDIDVPFYPVVSLTGISVTTLPSKLEYEKGEELSMEGAVVTAYYDDDSSKTITSYKVSGYDPEVTGEQTITVSFGNRTTTFKVTVAEPASAVVIGDANGDGVVDGMDATLLLQYAAGWDVTVDEAAGDANGDGVVDGMDATLLLQYAAGWDVTLGKAEA